MSKKKTSKKHASTLSSIKNANLDLKKLANLEEARPDLFFQDHAKIGAVLLQCLLENDTEAFIEIFDSYLRVNRSRVAKKANLSRATVQLALSKKGNPTLKTLAKIAHFEAGHLHTIQLDKRQR